MSKIWLTSDWHLGHKNIVGPKVSTWPSGYRIFSSIEEMDHVILDNVNRLVKHDDILYHLGDFSYRSSKGIINYRSRVNCQTIHLCLGNHDKEVRNKRERYLDIFASIEERILLKTNNLRIILSHYAHRVWDQSHRGSFHCYGHSHGSLPGLGKSMDVGVDNIYKLFGEYRPISLEEVVQIMNKKKIAFEDHHKSRE